MLDIKKLSLLQVEQMHARPSNSSFDICVRFLGADTSGHYAIVENSSNYDQSWGDYYVLMWASTNEKEPIRVVQYQTHIEAITSMARMYVRDNCPDEDTDEEVIIEHAESIKDTLFSHPLDEV